jgi:hypothetical protein
MRALRRWWPAVPRTVYRGLSDISSSTALTYAHVAPDPLSDRSTFEDISVYAAKRQTGVSLKTLMDTGEDVRDVSRRKEHPDLNTWILHRSGPSSPEALLWQGGAHHCDATDAAAGGRNASFPACPALERTHRCPLF